MRIRLVWLSVFICGIVAMGMASCATTDDSSVYQDFGNLVWKADGSGFIGFFERQLITVLTDSYTLGIFDGNGVLTGTVQTSLTATSNPNIFLNASSSAAVVQLGANLYKVDVPSGNQTLLATKVTLLVTSPDQHYAVVTPSLPGSVVSTISVLDILASPVREIGKWDVSDVDTRSGIWLKNGTFGLTVNNGAYQINIYDTVGHLVDSVLNAQQVFHNGNYVAATDELYFLTGGQGVDRLNLTTRTRDHIFTGEPVDNFDVAATGKIAGIKSTSGISVVNTQTFAKKLVTNDDVYWGVFLSPTGNRLAYIHQQPLNQIRDVHVIDVSLP